MEKIRKIAAFLEESGWIDENARIEFLAAGEYNENFLLNDSKGSQYVFRINHGSQLGLSNQIEYEFTVLKALEPSGVTPKVKYYDLHPKGIDGGVLLMEYIQGRPLDYQADWEIAADIFARIHSLPVSPDLVTQKNPILDIARESYSLLTRFQDHPLQKEQIRLLNYYETIVRLGEEKFHSFQNERMCIVNTEVNSHNFLIQGNRGYLIDWEKAVQSYRYQDLGHFLVPTTTLWKSDYVYTDDEKRRFLKSYHKHTTTGIPFEELLDKTRLLERTILLRGLSWCFMAYYEYCCTERTLKNMDTFNKIRDYLRDIEWFLN
jgi:predicted Ser/Thr protein kinase